MIEVRKSPTADTRTCDVTKATKEQLLTSSKMHISDVLEGMAFFANRLMFAGYQHDQDKLTGIEEFFSDFKGNFNTTGWWDKHRHVSRHHLQHKDGIPEDVNLIDVLEYITDCVMAGMARSGTVYDVSIDSEVLIQAFSNTVDLLKSEVVVND